MDGAGLWVVLALLLLVIIALVITVLRLVAARRSDDSAARQAADRLRQESEREADAVRARADSEATALLERAAADADRRAAQLITDAERRATHLTADLEQATAELQRGRSEFEAEVKEQRAELRELRRDHERREGRLADREQRADVDSADLTSRLTSVAAQEAALSERAEELATAEDAHRAELSRIAGLTTEAARAEVLASAEHEARRRAAILSRDIEEAARRNGEAEARKILVGAIQRLASEQTTESVVASVHLPSEDMKGRIIGREGRNIRTFEQVTGVNVLIDDTPATVLLSCFDPVRRETARLTLTELVEDGRIHPARIEEVYARAKDEIAERLLRAADAALAEVGIVDLHPDLLPTLGALKYRTSYGQNVLKHLIETAHVAGLMAAELGLDVALVKRGAFLHDIGKALTHESEGSHALVGAELARRHGEHPDVVHAIEAHHNEVEPRTVEAVLVQAADAISGARPGARREALEAYVQRLERLEEIALSHDGVDKVFAMQAGREVRVMVAPEQVDDIAAQVLAREIVKQVEEELTYPGQIRVTVVRESRATETAR
ncbi:ribonuclease Y [Propionibacteriaceae bacterium Y1685]|uniref:ribonuclease Y n=1 Tax=Microlunatus sp. Y1700 TaxID=3418487 RepID=UPI003B7B179C